jgi:tRNA(Ile)-lysidine synthase
MTSGADHSPPLPRGVAVAYSGGRDSTALLHATIRAAVPLGAQVHALHVHHGLSQHADAWLAACEQQCLRWRRRGWPVQFSAKRLSSRPPRGASVEAWAREQRYAALQTMALERGVGIVLLAHHRRDQAETFLLQAMRGAGVAGLGGMPRAALRGGIEWIRPWLHQPTAAIDNYVHRHRLRWVEDDSNTDDRFARNRLRAHVMPALQAAFPSVDEALVKSAAWASQALECLDELAALDLHTLTDASGLDVAAWRRLGEARRTNALRAWLAAQRTQDVVSAALTRRLMEELENNRPAQWAFGGGTLRLYRGRLAYHPGTATASQCDAEHEPSTVTHLDASQPGVHALPGWGGALVVRRCRSGGVPLAWLAHLQLRPRVGGEQFQAGVGRPPRSLKKQYQAAALPEWQRAGPLLYSGGQLVFVPGLGLDARVLALPGQPQARLEWCVSD